MFSTVKIILIIKLFYHVFSTFKIHLYEIFYIIVYIAYISIINITVFFRVIFTAIMYFSCYIYNK